MRDDYFWINPTDKTEKEFLELLEPKLEPIISSFNLESMKFETTKCSLILTYYKNERKLQLILYWCDEKGCIFYCHILKVSEVVGIPFVLTRPPKKYFHTLEELDIEMTLWVEFLKLELNSHSDFANSLIHTPTTIDLSLGIKMKYWFNYIEILSPKLTFLWDEYYIGGDRVITESNIIYNLSTNNSVSLDIVINLTDYLTKNCYLNCFFEYNNFKEIYRSNLVDFNSKINYIDNEFRLKNEIDKCMLFLKSELIKIPNMNKPPIEIGNK